MGPIDAEARILDATMRCGEQWGFAKVTIDDIAAASGVSRATIYRLFPGGKDVLFDALRVREINEFFDRVTAEVAPIGDLEDLLVRLVVVATHELRDHETLALLLASEPGEALSQLTVEGLPRIIRVATERLAPLVEPQLAGAQAAAMIDLLVRLTISYFLAPSDIVDLGDPASARRFIRPGLAAIAPTRT